MLSSITHYKGTVKHTMIFKKIIKCELLPKQCTETIPIANTTVNNSKWPNHAYRIITKKKVQTQPRSTTQTVKCECISLFRRKSFNQSTLYERYIQDKDIGKQLEVRAVTSQYSLQFTFIVGQHYGYRHSTI